VPLTERRPIGRDYLDLVSRLLQDARLAEPGGGLWEAADLQWWWRIDQHPDPSRASIWTDGERPVVAAVFTAWRDSPGCDLLGTDAAVAEHAARLWERVGMQEGELPLSMIVREDDERRMAAAERHGFVAGAATSATAWMDPADRPAVPPLPAGMRLEPYGGGAHPMVARNGPEVAARLAECPLYRADLDLAIRDGDELAGYALFWADPVTRVGLLEPMRIEDAYQDRGLSKALIAAGMERLAAAGCTRLKVTFDPANEPAARLYTGAGYRVRTTDRTWTRPAPQADAAGSGGPTPP
jgi:ribosomal protein S18 acetylase RimI-like enzyme